MSSSWFGANVTSQQEFTLKFDQMSLQSWGLSNRTLNALLSYNFKLTVGDIIRAGENLTTIRGLGNAGIEELIKKLSQLRAETRDFKSPLSTDGSTGLSNPGESVNHLPKMLPQSVQSLPIDQLHLDIRTHKALVKADISTIGELYQASDAYISDIQGFHFGSLGNINGSLIALLNSVSQEKELNWFDYWSHRQIQILPTTYIHGVPSEQIIEELPTIIEEVLSRELDERSGIIIKRRYGLGNLEKLTLEDIGNAFGGLSRERIRQLEEKALKKLQGIFVEQHYAGKNYHIHPAIHLMIKTIHDMIEAEPSKLILETKLLERVGQALNIDTRKVKSSLLLILPLMTIERIEFEYPNSVPAWGYVELVRRSTLENGIKRLDDLLTRDTPLSQTEFDILVSLNKKAKKSEKLTLAQLSGLVDLCNSIERCEDGSIRGKFESLKGRGNQVERLLFESAVPMSMADLAREINHRLVPLGQRRIIERNLTNQLIGDDRFVAIGRSGKWGLKSWSHIDTKSILTLMEECLITYNKPATIVEIFTYVSDRRPVSKHSILWYLTIEKETFVKVGRTTWGLAKWSDVADESVWSPEQVADFVATIFMSNKATELSYKLIKEAIVKEMGINAKEAQGLLSQNPVLKTRRNSAWGEVIAIYQPNYKTILARTKLDAPRQRATLLKQIEESTYNILSTAPNKQMSMAELILQLTKQLGCSPTTAYNYLTALDFIERINIPGSTKKICRLKGEIASNSVRKSTLHERVSASVRGILEAAPNKQMPLSELIAHLQKEYKSPKATLYTYITSLDYLEKLDIPGAQGKICRIKEGRRSERFPQIQSITDSTLREKVERALPFLTEENVDIGLFLLSKEFEATLKSYLAKASAKGKLQTLPPGKGPEKWTLNGMVDCAKDNGIITDHATFHYLRQARNDRAHGTMPSLAERELLMKHVQYIAGLYIDYIKLLDDLSQKL